MLQDLVHQRISDLEKIYPRIISCDIVVDAPQKKKVTGRTFEVHLSVHLPGPDIHVSRSYGRSKADEDVKLAINRVFNTAKRKLRQHSQKMGLQEIKHHAPVIHGVVDRLIPGTTYGFIKGDDGREVYFEADNLTGGNWADIKAGNKVRFREELGPKGPYATNVTISD